MALFSCFTVHFADTFGLLPTLLVTSLASGRIGDIIGRRKTLFFGAIIFTLGGFVQTFAVGFWSMVTGRFVSGFGVGLLSYVTTLNMLEIDD